MHSNSTISFFSNLAVNGFFEMHVPKSSKKRCFEIRSQKILTAGFEKGGNVELLFISGVLQQIYFQQTELKEIPFCQNILVPRLLIIRPVKGKTGIKYYRRNQNEALMLQLDTFPIV